MGERRRGGGSTLAAGAAALGLVLAGGGSAGTVLAHPISDDPYTNISSQHRTQVEADSFAFGNTIVAAFQTGRFSNGGASNIAWSTSTNAGRTWTTGVLPGTTIYQGGSWARISDPSVAYDPEHDVWMISTLALEDLPRGAAILTSRSTDGGLTWQSPVTTALSPETFFDKNWIVCDTWASSPHYGNCYTQWEDAAVGAEVMMSTSTDGGLTWSPIRVPADNPSGLGGQPVVQPEGTVIVPYSGGAGIRSFRSTDGGTTWSASTPVAAVNWRPPAGELRSHLLASAEVDGEGRVYVVWHDCRFRSGCAANDIVMTTSLDGLNWTAVTRIPIDPTTSSADHFIPGLAVDRATTGSGAHLALGYHYYPDRDCTFETCQMTVGFVSSLDGGATWAPPTRVAGPMRMSWIAETNQGRMVGDYMSTSFTADGKAHPVFATAKAPTGGVFSQRAATARFDITVPTRSPRLRAGKERAYRSHGQRDRRPLRRAY